MSGRIYHIDYLVDLTHKRNRKVCSQREIEETVRAEADRVGATVTSVTVERDPNVGLRAIVRATAGAEKMKEALDRYAFRSDVSQG